MTKKLYIYNHKVFNGKCNRLAKPMNILYIIHEILRSGTSKDVRIKKQFHDPQQEETERAKESFLIRVLRICYGTR